MYRPQAQTEANSNQRTGRPDIEDSPEQRQAFNQRQGKRSKKAIEEISMPDKIKVKCQACGEAENCFIYCVLEIDNIYEIDKLCCPVTGEECEWEVMN